MHKKFPQKNWRPSVAKDPKTSLDVLLEQKKGFHELQRLAFESRSKINQLLQGRDPVKAESKSFEEKVRPRGFALVKYKEELEKQRERHSASQKVNLSAQTAPEEKKYKTSEGLILDEWQNKALQALLAGKHVIVDAPTSAGKTRVIEALLEYRMQERAKLIYTSPVKSLSNDKYREFTEKYGRENVGINTGDFKENLSASIILATLETYRNSLLGIEPNMSRRVVVYDEYHFLQDESRGSAWEESLILTPPGSQLILLSASVPNCEEFAEWITQLTGVETEVIKVTKRPVPLIHVVHTKHGWILADDLQLKNEELELFSKTARTLRRENRNFRGREVYNSFIPPIVSALEMNMGPVVIYAGRRGDVEGIALSFARHFKQDYSGKEAEKLRERLKTLSGYEYVPPELKRLISRYGIAYHHSGMIPPGRVAVESLLKEGLLRLCCGTMGISLGVNFAVRSAFVSDESRPSEGGEVRYSNTEIMQMLGRAGRRGQDKQGFSLWLHVGRYADQKPKNREHCTSSLKFDPTTVISILGQHKNISYLSEFYRKSFFMRSKNLTNKSLESALNKIVNHLQKVGALDGAVPTEMGHLARHFPQAGGLIVASWFASGQLNKETFPDFLQAMAAFGSAHFKEIPDTHADMKFLKNLNIPVLIEKYYPYSLFPELYDEIKPRRGAERAPEGESFVFREFNLGAASIVKHWLNPKTSWDDLVEAHSSKYFSAGDCMNVLFRFATFLQSCIRLQSLEPAIAAEAKRLQKILLREPLDARNRMLIEEADEFENVPLK